MTIDLEKLIREGQDRLLHLYDDQLAGESNHTAGDLYGWYNETVLASGALQEDPHPHYVEYLTEARVVSPDLVSSSGTLTDRFPETNAYGRTSTDDRKLPPRLQAGGSLDLRGLRKVMHRVLSVIQPDLRFVPAYPDWVKPTDLRSVRSFPTTQITDSTSMDQQGSTFTDTITFKVIRRLCGTLDRNARPSAGGKREIKPGLRQSAVQSRLYTNRLIDIYGQWFDNWIQFDLFTRTNEEGELFVEWFENFMEIYAPVFMWAGISKMHFWERLIDEELTKWKTGLSVRSIVWYFRTEKLFEVDVHKIKQINIALYDLITNEDDLHTFYDSRRHKEPWEAMASGLAW